MISKTLAPAVLATFSSMAAASALAPTEQLNVHE